MIELKIFTISSELDLYVTLIMFHICYDCRSFQEKKMFINFYMELISNDLP